MNMKQREIALPLLLILQLLIGGWAFMRMLDPASMLDILRLFSFC